MAWIKCTPFCKPDCTQKHHELLLAILNSPSDSKGNKKSENSGELDEFEACVQTFLKKGWQKDDIVPDAVEDYQFPLIHWASVLGKLKALEWLVKNGFDPTVRAPKTKETALHRCLLCLELTEMFLHRKVLQRKMEALIDLLKNCLLLRDNELDMPLHVAARQLLEGHKKDHFEDCIKLMLSTIKEYFPDKLNDILNAKNKAGDTIVHILGRCEDGFFSLRTVINEGASTSVTNADGKTPLEVATEWGSLRATILLKKTANERMSDSEVETDLNPDIAITVTDKGVQAQDTTGNKTLNMSSRVRRHPVCTCKVKKEGSNNLQDITTTNILNTDQSSSALLDLLSGAGLWDNVKELALKKRKKDETILTKKLEELQGTNEAIEDAKKVVDDTQAKISSKAKELESLQKELEDKKTELNYIKNEHKLLKRKQSLLNNECSQLEKKLHYCDSLLKVDEKQQDNHNS